MIETHVIEIGGVVIGTLIGYAKGVSHTRRAAHEALHRRAAYEALQTIRIADSVAGDHADRLRELVLDWDRYTLTIGDAEWRDEMRRAVVFEMRVEIAALAEECGLAQG